MERTAHRRFFLGRLDLDAVDLKMLSILQNEGRISKSDLAKRVNLSASACFERVRRLEHSGLIASYHATLRGDLLAGLQFFRTQIVLESHRSHTFSRFETYVKEANWIVDCEALGGEIDYTIGVVCRSVAHYQDLVEGMLEAGVGVQRYYTYVVTKSVKRGSPDLAWLLLPEANPRF
ncbi:Lrp/AsnC family transcriptional regulator [Pelagibacterium sediminicola]|uniref:Lrp/AsnC family transcriptional regulator n=1 Tax=Pelagibacterium sediminicola TaxID=2248761 RepID=UPI000E31B144|nr:Lrp/AsnC family transcriptional regulator [Pelagibacterium sediminicola]